MPDGDIVVLVSLGRSPVSGRGRRAAEDAAAVEMALGLADAATPPRLLHAGAAGAAALRQYLGMGVPALTVIEVPEGDDPALALRDHLRSVTTSLILCGSQAEAGEASGYLPYWLSAALDMPLVADVVGLRRDGEGWEATLAAAGGRRRKVWSARPLVATVGPNASPPRAVAHGPALRGSIDVRRPAAPHPASAEARVIKPARHRPKRLSATRLVETAQNGARVGLGARKVAEEIAAFLVAKGFLTSRRDA